MTGQKSINLQHSVPGRNSGPVQWSQNSSNSTILAGITIASGSKIAVPASLDPLTDENTLLLPTSRLVFCGLLRMNPSSRVSKDPISSWKYIHSRRLRGDSPETNQSSYLNQTRRPRQIDSACQRKVDNIWGLTTKDFKGADWLPRNKAYRRTRWRLRCISHHELRAQNLSQKKPLWTPIVPRKNHFGKNIPPMEELNQ